MAYQLKGVAGQNYNQLTPEEQAKVQGAGDTFKQKNLSTIQSTWSPQYVDEFTRGTEQSAQEEAQRMAESIFTQKSNVLAQKQVADAIASGGYGKVTTGNANTIPNIQAQGQANLQGAVPVGSAGDMLQKGIASGAVSPTSPEQQFAASMQGNTKNIPGVTPSAPSPDINAKYAQAFQQAQTSGAIAPSGGGDARSMVQSYVPPQAQANPVLDNLFAEDKNIANFSTMVQDYLNPKNQQTSLKQEYESLTKAKGIEGMNTELMNMKNVIEGTEDDIRTEITKTGGFATDSQVMALTNARNKTLIKNYNNLLQTKQQAEDYVNTLMGLEQTDRQMASERMDKQLNLTMQLAQMQQSMQKNAQDTLNNVVSQVGYAGLAQMTQGNPYYTSLVENTLGLGAGGLQQLATYTPPVNEMDQLELENQKLQNQKLEKELAGGGGGKLLSVSEAKELGVPYGTTENDAGKMGIVPGSVNGVDEKTQAKIQASPEYKTINGVLPAIQALTAFKKAIDTYGTTEQVSGQGKGELAGTYGNALATWKSLAGLGALSGADFALAENAVPSTGFWQRESTMKGKLDSSIKNAIEQAEILTRRLQQNYPAAKDNLQRQLDEAKVMAYPDKFKMGSDGNVYEVTN